MQEINNNCNFKGLTPSGIIIQHFHIESGKLVGLIYKCLSLLVLIDNQIIYIIDLSSVWHNL